MRISDWSSDVCSSDLGRIRTRSLASSSPNEKRAPGALFANAILYVETPAGGIKPVSGAPDVDHTPARGLIGDVAAQDRKSGGWGKSVSGRVALGGTRIINN